MSKFETDCELGCQTGNEMPVGHPIERSNLLENTTDGLFSKNEIETKGKCPSAEIVVTQPARTNNTRDNYDNYLNAIAGDRNFLMQSNDKGFTNLHQLSIETSDSRVIHKAIQTLKAGKNFESDVGRQNYLGHSPLFLSILARNKTFTVEFLKAGAPINQIDYLGKTIFHYMADRNAQAYTEEIFKSHTFKTNAIPMLQIWDAEGVTPMQVAVQEGNMVAFQNFYQFGEEQLKLKDKKRGYSMLHLAAERGNTYLIDFLLKKGIVNVNEKGLDDATPLHVAVSNGEMEVVRSLLDARADPTTFLRENSLLGLIPMECEDEMRALISQKVDAATFKYLSEYSEYDLYSDSDDEDQ